VDRFLGRTRRLSAARKHAHLQHGGGIALDTLIGPTYDGLDIITGNGEWQANAMAFELWCLLLNHGYRLAPTASSDACFDRRGGAMPGVARTYAYLGAGERFSLPAVAQAMARGATFVTTGPLLLASIGANRPGLLSRPVRDSATLSLEAWASGTDEKGLSKWEILRNGKLFWSNAWAQPVSFLATNITLQESQDAWYCARVFGGDPRKQRAVTGAFFFETKPYLPPPPAPVRVQIVLRDAVTGTALTGTVTEVTYLATLPKAGKVHPINRETESLTLPGVVRLRAEAAGYQPLTLSPFLDNPPLLETVTGLKAEDLVQWATFERVRALLRQVQLTFQLARSY